ncbi:MAG: flagellar export protein FliJ [Desulfovibrio sp.]|nr:flagellar export protein FliJ [Desulfovibrio sp.]
MGQSIMPVVFLYPILEDYFGAIFAFLFGQDQPPIARRTTMPFHFRMQKILDYREQLEEEARIRLGQAQARVNSQKERCRSLEEQIQNAEQKNRDNPAMNAADFWITEQYMRGLSEDLKQAQHEYKMALALRDEAQKLLTTRAIDKKMLAKLKERQQSVWNHEEKQKEQHFNDEIATIRYNKAPAY